MEFYHGVSKEEYVHKVFSRIAQKYDFLNSVLSFNQDKYWRAFAVKKACLSPGDIVLDVACGTGKLTLAEACAMGRGRVIGVDFCQEMLNQAACNVAGKPEKSMIEFRHANARELPFAQNTFQSATIAFGLRNMPDYHQVLAEMVRVVKPGGRVVSLELAKPSLPIFKQLYYFYFERILPFLGKCGIGQDGPYQWLPESLKYYPHQRVITEYFTMAGLESVVCYELTGGIVAVHVGMKPQERVK